MSICEGEPLLWPEDYIRGICCYVGEEQSACSCAEYALYCLTCTSGLAFFVSEASNHTEMVGCCWDP